LEHTDAAVKSFYMVGPVCSCGFYKVSLRIVLQFFQVGRVSEATDSQKKKRCDTGSFGPSFIL
jgi:hypothetical protein